MPHKRMIAIGARSTGYEHGWGVTGHSRVSLHIYYYAFVSIAIRPLGTSGTSGQLGYTEKTERWEKETRPNEGTRKQGDWAEKKCLLRIICAKIHLNWASRTQSSRETLCP